MPTRDPLRRRRFSRPLPAILLGAVTGLLAGGAVPATPVGAQETSASAETTPTRLVVRAVSHDAKVIGSGVGGARITVRDPATGEILAEGVQEGGTGETDAIMGARGRGDTVFDHDGTAAFAATLPLAAPTRVVVEAEGPLATLHATQTASASLLMLPGVDVVGEGLILVLHGFTVKLEGAAAGEGTLPAGPLPVRVDVSMLCGCPIEAGGMWDADRITVTAELLRDGRVVATGRLPFAGETNIFEGELVPPAAGHYHLRVTAVDADRANAGMVTRSISVGPA